VGIHPLRLSTNARLQIQSSFLTFLPLIRTISWEPRAQVWEQFLTPEECDTLISEAAPNLQRSMVVDATGKARVDSARSSSGYWFMNNNNPILQKASKQISDWTHIPIENGEAFYAIRYEKGEQYMPHHDFFADGKDGEAFKGAAGNRVATVLVYLHSPTEGGETIFPSVSVTTKAKRGSALMFWDYHPNFVPDYKSLHGGNPVINGTKWSMTRWIRMRRYY